MPLLTDVQSYVRKLVNAYKKPFSFKDGVLMSVEGADKVDKTPEKDPWASVVCALKQNVPEDTFFGTPAQSKLQAKIIKKLHEHRIQTTL